MPDFNLVGAGGQSNIEAQVDPTHNSLRVSIRPADHVQQGIIGGHYQLAATWSNTAAKPTAGSDVVSLRWTDSRLLFIPLRITIIKIDTTGYTAVGAQDLALYVARSFTVSPSGGTQIIPLAGGQVVRSGIMKKTGFDGSSGVLWVSSGDLLTTGTRTLDTQPIGYISYGNSNAVGSGAVNSDIYNVRDFSEHPLVITANEGLVLQTPIGNSQAAGVSKYAMQLEYGEMAAY